MDPYLMLLQKFYELWRSRTLCGISSMFENTEDWFGPCSVGAFPRNASDTRRTSSPQGPDVRSNPCPIVTDWTWRSQLQSLYNRYRILKSVDCSGYGHCLARKSHRLPRISMDRQKQGGHLNTWRAFTKKAPYFRTSLFQGLLFLQMKDIGSNGLKLN